MGNITLPSGYTMVQVAPPDSSNYLVVGISGSGQAPGSANNTMFTTGSLIRASGFYLLV